MCTDLADPLQNKDKPFRLWDEARGVCMMFSGARDYLRAGAIWAGWRLYLTPNNDRSLAVIVKIFQSNHPEDI